MCEWIPSATFRQTQPQRYNQMFNVDASRPSRSPEGNLAPTGKDIEGPFYRPNSALGDSLCDANEPGDKLVLTGKVLDTHPKRVLEAKDLGNGWTQTRFDVVLAGK